MFEGMESLISIDLSGFNATNTISMDSLFSNCISLKTLDLS
jgi:surface protein